MTISRSSVFEILGTIPKNPRWSWCAIAPNHERAVFTLWIDEKLGDRYLLFKEQQSGELHHGAKELKENLDIAIEEGIQAYGLVCEAQNVDAQPRTIGKVHADFLIKLKIERKEDGIYAIENGRVYLAEIVQKLKRDSNRKMNNGLDDINSIPPGSKTPDRAHVVGIVVKRDQKVRQYVISKAQGKCEFCGKHGFEMISGRKYLEAHHVITLANQGADTITNVIALCPEHHREAHYGINAEKLEKKFLTCIQKRNS